MLNFTRKKKTIDVDGVTVNLVEASEGEIQSYGNSFHDAKGRPIKAKMVDARVQLIILCVVNDDGTKMFDETHATEIRQWPSSVTKRIHEAAAELCGLDDGEDELEKK